MLLHDIAFLHFFFKNVISGFIRHGNVAFDITVEYYITHILNRNYVCKHNYEGM